MSRDADIRAVIAELDGMLDSLRDTAAELAAILTEPPEPVKEAGRG